ncbi:MAG: 50S ribosomal protein L19 [Candidatus Tagabacteria bacterium CG_4_10_14_0_2_um_filter_40_13]|uniref:50S ribosomal protein L19 n=3 Tax=Candidatus Tagaibacteriota TaxID=1817918 RepID=A0A2M8G8S5_9BACT|nr:MAG: 50S ribosomal protein L19 [Candidatus Tagabacteria bacterium CG11_big_fil_rev_8_21_14_0_20_41_11]PIU99547.1 MAG: 50S ribosomal protein L19 [Candidatus Tagabacteria bacterium CG03_land_8_20_14_0_80_41_22]PIZ56810.1 MAG: 50S ribosomal protein L19 [Candidatus Tagabacteria bacterium CG_4_10_14_0_2_um_filter_40_13]PJC25458.1 MAG: 50S ribosomal protein L19 [Candidatus Tagabacteria bacterium CG_4_9_14_0_2_um_filter_41_11]PJC69795.1 MAG: 50S ribosomal protein L19 [Candidatus Tagabacteria bacter
MTTYIIEERKNIDLQPGSIVKVWQKIKEGDKTRLQIFEGLIIAKKHGMEPGATFTVRKMVGDIGVERIFPLYSPNIEKIEVVSRSKVRRAKLYYIREKTAKAIRKRMKQIKVVAKTPEKPEKKEEAPTL